MGKGHKSVQGWARRTVTRVHGCKGHNQTLGAFNSRETPCVFMTVEGRNPARHKHNARDFLLLHLGDCLDIPEGWVALDDFRILPGRIVGFFKQSLACVQKL